jgi:hypothetical protein
MVSFPWGSYVLHMIDNQRSTTTQLCKFDVNYFCATPNLIIALPNETAPWKPFQDVQYNKVIFDFSAEKAKLFAPNQAHYKMLIAEKVNLSYDELVLAVCTALFICKQL